MYRYDSEGALTITGSTATPHLRDFTAVTAVTKLPSLSVAQFPADSVTECVLASTLPNPAYLRPSQSATTGLPTDGP